MSSISKDPPRGGRLSVDSAHRVTAVTAEFAALVEREPADMVGVAVARLIHHDDRLLALAALDQVRRTGEPHQVAVRFVLRRGAFRLVRWTALQASPGIVDIVALPAAPAGPPADRDQTRSPGPSSASDGTFRDLIHAIQDYAIVMLDRDGRVQSWGAGAESILGYSADEIIGRHFSVFFTEDDVAAGRPNRELENSLQEGRSQDEGWRVRKDGSRLWADVVVTALKDDAGQVRGFAKVARDLTSRREMEQTIRRLNAKLKERVRERTAELEAASETRRQLELQLMHSQKMEALGRLAGGVAHDFNNLLTVIIGHSELLMELAGSSEQREHLHEIRDASRRSVELVRQLLAFSRKQILTPRVLELNQVVKGLMPMIRRLIGEDIHVHTRLEPSLQCVNADPTQVEQVILNLVVNARDAMPEGGDITLETSNLEVDPDDDPPVDLAPGKYVRLAISDTGHGMDETTLKHLFEPFYTTKPKGKGTGLGLSTVHGIVEQSGGHIRVMSERGQGAVFEIDLPAVPAESETAASVSGGRAASRSTGGTILLVEDEPALLRFTRAALVASGYRVLVAQDGIQAQQVAAEHDGRIDLLLTDIVMPNMNGVEAARHLKAARPEMKAVYVSGYADKQIVEDADLESSPRFLAKPYSRESLCDTVARVLSEGTETPRSGPAKLKDGTA